MSHGAAVLAEIPATRDSARRGATKGHWPLAGYLFYFLNQPDFMRPDLTLHLAVAPTYLDSEFGFKHASYCSNSTLKRGVGRRPIRRWRRYSIRNAHVVWSVFCATNRG